MTTLVIDTATEACSVALLDGERVIAATHDVVGRGHAEHLLPMIAALPGGGRANAILVDCGPGSFTGVRVGLAAAIGLGIGWDVPVHGYSSTALIAVAAFAQAADRSLAVVLEGGHGEVFMQAFDRSQAESEGLVSLKPEAALERLGNRWAVGNGVRHLSALAPDRQTTHALPDAANARLLPPAFIFTDPRPIYGRAPDAKPQAAR